MQIRKKKKPTEVNFFEKIIWVGFNNWLCVVEWEGA
jgi:hypothetical protein